MAQLRAKDAFGQFYQRRYNSYFKKLKRAQKVAKLNAGKFGVKKKELLTRYKMVVQVDGTNFHSWTSHPNKLSAQDILEVALEGFSKNKEVKVQSASSFGKGSHALRQVIHVDLKREWESGYRVPSWEPDWVIKAVNYKLNQLKSNFGHDIRVVECEKVPPNHWNAKWSRKDRSHLYRISEDIIPSSEDVPENLLDCRPFPLLDNNLWRIPLGEELDLEKMRKASDIFLGYQDSKALLLHEIPEVSKDKDSEPEEDEYHTFIESIDIIEKENTEVIPFPEEFYPEHLRPKGRRIDIIFKGYMYLQFQIRVIIGILVRVGRGQIDPETIKTILTTTNEPSEELTSMLAPAEGLFLADVAYGEQTMKFSWQQEKNKLKFSGKKHKKQNPSIDHAKNTLAQLSDSEGEDDGL